MNKMKNEECRMKNNAIRMEVKYILHSLFFILHFGNAAILHFLNFPLYSR